MFDWIVRSSLHNRLFVLAIAALLLVCGAITAWRAAAAELPRPLAPVRVPSK